MKTGGEKHVKPGKRKFRTASLITAFLVILLSFAAVAAGLVLPGIAAELQSRKIERTYKTEELEPDMLFFESSSEIYEPAAELPAELQGGN